MLPVQLTYGNEGFKEIKDFLKKNYHEDYTLSINNNLEQSTIEVICDFDSMMDVILYVPFCKKGLQKTHFVKLILDNPVYAGYIAYGR